MDQLHRRLKAQLRLSITRLRLLQSKKSALAKQQRRDLAQLLEKGKLESAKIRVENVIREDVNTELLEILELFVRSLLAQPGECDIGLEEAIQTIIYCATKTEVKELQTVRELLMQRFGKEFSLRAIGNSESKVNAKVLVKLRIDPPDLDLVDRYLTEIARTYDIPYGDDSEDDSEEGVLRESADLQHGPIAIAPPSPSTENLRPLVHIPKEIAPAVHVPLVEIKTERDFDNELQKRFDALRKR
ncbi:Vacuolar protein sorting-associated protein IST1 [Neolecta irregularis DAH-3]|uniref:Vacuolar protein sorting-associated protein IST1 n=1 Tax=Neolecta irregularis (strain DAH-3) TaxID=1198029 RepID=A0A1U7LSR0_NEOID|nr:Vacuolar protein sorting-associated protein IST1 [Neolecta irregularis DAH-3]|eukprot:OLL25684.1 Vacuolar protein sorting-associated protein IST1 [Neolecta irregularis DAH-3]